MRKDRKLNAHHINSFANNEELRLDILNGITLCEEHHSIKSKGSLHITYGVKDVSPKELEDYINMKRRELGINKVFSIDEYISKKETMFE